METSIATSYTLIGRACDPEDERSWVEFVERYRTFIRHVLLQMGISQDDVDDVAQKILVSLVENLGNYDQNLGRFRSWLFVVIRRRAIDHLRRQRYRSGRLRILGENRDADWIFSNEVTELDDRIEREWQAYVANLAMIRVAERFQGKAVKAFELYLDGLSAEEISRVTGLAVASVYTLRKRVKKHLYHEIRAVTAELELQPGSDGN